MPWSAVRGGGSRAMTISGFGCTVVSALILLLASATPAFAYLDPGTGSLILQSLIGAVAGALVTVKLYWVRIRRLFSSRGAVQDGEDGTREGD